MGTLEAENHKRELDDSGCVQDESQPAKRQACDDAVPPVQLGLLDLSDDVLYLILKRCNPKDLKAVGFTCERFANMIRDHMLWQYVDARQTPYGKKRFGWLVYNVLNPMTTVLKVYGYAKDAKGCLGINPPTAYEFKMNSETNTDTKEKSTKTYTNKVSDNNKPSGSGTTSTARKLRPRGNKPTSGVSTVSRSTSTPSWKELAAEDDSDVETNTPTSASACPGPIFTLSYSLLHELKLKCNKLTSLSIEYCNISAHMTKLKHFPTTLKKFSLRGTRIYNLSTNTSYIYRINEYLKDLEYIDVSECDWLDSASFLPLSKLKKLKTLIMRHCLKMFELVAYSSLGSRYGFRKLEVIDLRYTPFGDSELSSLGWLPELRELYISPPPKPERYPQHSHNFGDVLPAHTELEPWEEEREHYLTQSPAGDSAIEEDDSEVEPVQGEKRERSSHCETAQHCFETSQDRIRQRCNSSDAHSSVNGEDEQSSNTDKDENCDEPQNDDKKSHKSQKRNVKDQDGLINPNSDCGNKSGPSKRKTDSDSKESHEVPSKRSCQNGVNDGASTSRGDNNEDNKSGPNTTQESNSNHNNVLDQFRVDVSQIYPRREEMPQHMRDVLCLNSMNFDAPLTHRIMFVTIGRQSRTMVCQVAIENETSMRLIRDPAIPFQLYTPPTLLLNRTTLVTDIAVLRFGRADNENIGYIRIGPDVPVAVRENLIGTRPHRSNLRVLSITGYQTITDRSLMHLSTSAPHLTHLDLSRTNVTGTGVDMFRALRPDCEVKFSEFVDET